MVTLANLGRHVRLGRVPLSISPVKRSFHNHHGRPLRATVFHCDKSGTGTETRRELEWT